MMSLAILFEKQRRFDEALAHHRDAVPILEGAAGPDSVRVVDPLTGVGRCLLELRRPSEAPEPLARALAILERSDASPSARAGVELLLGRALWGSEPARARALGEAARGRLRALGTDGVKQLAEVDAWLASPQEDGSMPPSGESAPTDGE